MRSNKQKHKSRRWKIAAASLLAAAALGGVLSQQTPLQGQTPNPRASTDRMDVFTPAHSSLGEAIRHFLGLRPEPVQPIPFTHTLHVNEVGLQCQNCHLGVTRGPYAVIPSVTLCMGCHQTMATEREPIQMLTSYFNQGMEPPWQRVYGWTEEAHVRFNHAPHIRAEVECATCHGDVASMTVAEPVVEHTMGFCIACHAENNASNECMTCHY